MAFFSAAVTLLLYSGEAMMSPWWERKSCLRARAASGMPLADSRSESKSGSGKSRREMTVTSAPAAAAPAAAAAASF